MKYFRENEFSDFEKMNPILLDKLDAYREEINMPVIITSSTRGEHSTNSEHYRGNAVDIAIPRSSSLFECAALALKMRFSGVGIYPQWKYMGIEIGGLHIDVREKIHTCKSSTWIGLDIDGHRKYVSMNEFNMKKYGIICNDPFPIF